MYDALLFLHVLSAFIAFATVAIFSAYTLGAPIGRGDFALADWSWNVSGGGLLIFGVWLALYVDGYEIWDGWILGALALFAVISVFGAMARNQVLPAVDGAEPPAAQVTLWHWLRTIALIGILVLMIWKPGA